MLLLRFADTFLVISMLFVSMPTNVKSSAVLIADFSMSRMIALSSKYPFCTHYKDKYEYCLDKYALNKMKYIRRGDIQRMLLAADQRRIRQVPRDSVVALEAVCNDSKRLDEKQQGGLGFIYPGTKWCGPGSIANDYEDLGFYTEEDRCCREHDFCPHTLTPGECRKGLCNTGRFTRSHCDCDGRFRRCLQDLNTETANTIGAVFFNVVQVICFRERSPCSIWQRSDPDLSKYYQNAHECKPAFQFSKVYVPPNDKFIASVANKRFLIGVPNSRSLDVEDSNEVADDSSVRLGVKVASIGLVARNLLKEAIRTPIDGLIKFIHKTFS